MRAAIFEAYGGPLEVRHVADPEVDPDAVVVQVRANGICRSDWHGWKGHDSDVRLPHVPGHELAGVIDQVGAEVRNFQIGDRVTVPFCCGCGRCSSCLRGDLHVCEDYFQPGFTAWGSFAQRVAVRYADANLVRLPESLDFLTAASLGCRFATAFRAVVHQGRLQGGQSVVVFGCGGVGLSAIMIAAALGGRVWAVDRREQPLQLAAECGAETLLVDDGEDEVRVAQRLRELTRGGADLTIDAVGSGAVTHSALLALRRRGRHVHVGLMLGPEFRPRVPLERVIAYELQLLGSHGMPAHQYPQLLSLVQTGRLRPEKLITRRVSLDEAAELLPNWDTQPGSGVTVIDRFE